MKYAKILLSLLLVAAVALSMSLVSCSPAPQQDGGTGDGGGQSYVWTGPKIEIVVKLLPGATNLIDSINNFTNDIRIVGSIGGLKLASDTRVVLSDWKPEDSRAKLSFVSNDSDGLPLYKIVLANDLTNNIT
ncbi:MAG: hypothetical protein N2712_02045, partial [Brevinematales bacterium]|nr:hypothetical protein [Brevinematales bacterium]